MPTTVACAYSKGDLLVQPDIVFSGAKATIGKSGYRFDGVDVELDDDVEFTVTANPIQQVVQASILKNKATGKYVVVVDEVTDDGSESLQATFVGHDLISHLFHASLAPNETSLETARVIVMRVEQRAAKPTRAGAEEG